MLGGGSNIMMLKILSVFLMAYSLVAFLSFLSMHRSGVLEQPMSSKMLPSRHGRRTERSSDLDVSAVAVDPIASAARTDETTAGKTRNDETHSAKTKAAIDAKTEGTSHETFTRSDGGGVVARRRDRFPSFGTAEFARRCGWALPSPVALPAGGGREGGGGTTNDDDDDEECIIYVSPEPNGSAGVSLWMSQIVTGCIVSKQAGCRLLFDYGPGTNVTELFLPWTTTVTTKEEEDDAEYNSRPDINNAAYFAAANDWRVPSGFQCLAKDGCFPAPWDHAHESVSFDVKPLSAWKKKKSMTAMNTNVADAPNYRYASVHAFAFSKSLIRSDFRELFSKHLTRSDFGELKDALPGFDIETGYACALGSLLRLSPSAAKYEGGLFRDILPALRDEDALVLTLYVRTHHADKMATNEEAGEDVPAEDVDLYDRRAGRHIKCALTLEEHYLKAAETSPDGGTRFSRIVWMLVTDSTEQKRRIKDKYDSSNVNAAPPTSPETVTTKKRRNRRRPSADATSPIQRSAAVPRTVLTTGTHGVHTRTRRDPSTADLVEALIDWYLIGESDLVIMDGPSFGATGALRTARPIYNARRCSQDGLMSNWAASVHEKPF